MASNTRLLTPADSALLMVDVQAGLAFGVGSIDRQMSAGHLLRPDSRRASTRDGWRQPLNRLPERARPEVVRRIAATHSRSG